MSTIKIKPQAWLRSRQPYFNGSGAEARRAPQGLHPERRLQAAAADAASVPACLKAAFRCPGPHPRLIAPLPLRPAQIPLTLLRQYPHDATQRAVLSRPQLN